MSKNVLSEDCIAFLNALNEKFEADRIILLRERTWSRLNFFNPPPAFKCNVPEELRGRRVEITGPAAPTKMVVNAMNSSADGYMADFEDSLSPTWENVLEGHKALVDVVDGTLSRVGVYSKGKEYKINVKSRTILHVRPRGLHMTEKNMFGMSASLFDFGVNFFNTIYRHKAKGTRPYYYLPKLESPEEATWWAKVFDFAENYMEVPSETIKCTVLVETLGALKTLENIAYRLKDRLTGLNAGRWDFIFSHIRDDKTRFLPFRDLVDMKTDMMNSYAKRIVDVAQSCGASPIGGMSAFVPQRGQPEKNEEVLKKVKADKYREKEMGFIGGWVAHPSLVEVVKECFDQPLHGVSLGESPMPFAAKPTKEELSENINISLQYMTAWLKGNGCVAIEGKMEDLATAEISRIQLSDWIEREEVSHKEFILSLAEECAKIGDKSKEFDAACDILMKLSTGRGFARFQIKSEERKRLNRTRGSGPRKPSRLYGASIGRECLSCISQG
jgi:malate synthase